MDWKDFLNIWKAEQVQLDADGEYTDKDEVKKEKRPLRNKDIQEYIVKHFEHELKENSFEEVVTFPMSFTVVLNQKDFGRRKDYAVTLAKHVVKKFYQTIRNAMEKVKSEENMKPVCENLATYWNISFVPCGEEVMEVNENHIQVPEGQMAIFCSVHDRIATIDEKNETGSLFSVNVGGSSIFNNVNINFDTIKNLKLVSESHFQFAWDPTLPVGEGGLVRSHEEMVFPVAKLVGEQSEFNILNGTCEVSGMTDTRSDSRELSILKVKSENVIDGHIRIQYLEHENKFKMAAFGITYLNNDRVAISTKNNVFWTDLKDGDIINLGNDDVVFTFKKLS